MVKNNTTKKGFSIGEVMVAMFILLVGILDAVFLTVRSVDSLGNSRDIIMATLLAQEGTELVRNVRDNNVTEFIAGFDGPHKPVFDTGYGFPATSPAICTIDHDLASSVGELQCSGGSMDDNLYLNRSNGMYSHSNSSGENFKGLKRRIYITYGYTDGNPGNIESKYADVTSVVVFGGEAFPVDIDNIDTTCFKSRNCAYAQTRLTSWINYGE